MTRPRRPRPGSPQWRAQFDRDRARFDRQWPWMVAVSLLVAAALAIVTAIMIATGAWPVWLLLV